VVGGEQTWSGLAITSNIFLRRNARASMGKWLASAALSSMFSASAGCPAPLLRWLFFCATCRRRVITWMNSSKSTCMGSRTTVSRVSNPDEYGFRDNRGAQDNCKTLHGLHGGRRQALLLGSDALRLFTLLEIGTLGQGF
jgi:hypothetical protein